MALMRCSYRYKRREFCHLLLLFSLVCSLSCSGNHAPPFVLDIEDVRKEKGEKPLTFKKQPGAPHDVAEAESFIDADGKFLACILRNILEEQKLRGGSFSPTTACQSLHPTFF